MIIDSSIITKPIITNPIKINKNTFVYLIYYPNAGYSLLSDVNKSCLLNSIESTKTPNELENIRQTIARKNNNSHKLEENLKDSKELEQLYKILDNYIYKSYKLNDNEPADKSNYINTWETLGELIGDLEDIALFNYAEYKINNQPKHLRKYLLNDDLFIATLKDSFKLYTEDKHGNNIIDAKTAKNKANDELKNIQRHINIVKNDLTKLNLFCRANDIKKSALKTERLNKEIIAGLNLNPMQSLQYSNDKIHKTNLPQFLINEFDIKTVYENGKLNKYYYNKNNGYYTFLNVPTLQQLITENYDITLTYNDVRTGFEAISTTDKKQENLLLFKNGVYDINLIDNKDIGQTGFIEDLETQEYFTTNLIGFSQKDNTIKLLEFDTGLFLSDFLKPKDLNEPMTLTEKTLRQILIPKNNKTDISLFQDYLERLGSCILKKRVSKSASFLYGSGDDGKSILKLLLELIYNVGVKNITPSVFDDAFNANDFLNKNVMVLDEVDKKFLDSSTFKNEFKNMVSLTGNKTQRAIYSNEMIHIKQFPLLFILSNELPTVNMGERNLLSRYDVFFMPNKFVSKSELNKYDNVYLKNENLADDIKKDYNGLSWLITASILAFKDMINNNREFRRTQTENETLRILLNKSIEEEFILLYTELNTGATPAEYITNKEILEQFNKYMELKGEYNNKSNEENSKKIGYTLKRVYPDLKHNNRYPRKYNIKLKSFDDVIKENKQVYIINEDLTETEVNNITYLDSDSRLIYKDIQNGINTINKLNRKYSNIDIRDCLNNLYNCNLIINTFNTSIV